MRNERHQQTDVASKFRSECSSTYNRHFSLYPKLPSGGEAAKWAWWSHGVWKKCLSSDLLYLWTELLHNSSSSSLAAVHRLILSSRSRCTSAAAVAAAAAWMRRTNTTPPRQFVLQCLCQWVANIQTETVDWRGLQLYFNDEKLWWETSQHSASFLFNLKCITRWNKKSMNSDTINVQLFL